MPGNKPYQSAIGRGGKTPGVALFRPLVPGIFLAERIRKRHHLERGSPSLLKLVWRIPGGRLFRPLRSRIAFRPKKHSGDKGPGLLLRVIRIREKTPGRPPLVLLASGASGGTEPETFSRYILILEPSVFLRERITLRGILSPTGASSPSPPLPSAPKEGKFLPRPEILIGKESLRIVREGSPEPPVTPSGEGPLRKEITPFLDTVRERRDLAAPAGGVRRENFTLLWRVRGSLGGRKGLSLVWRGSFPGSGPGFTEQREIPGEDSRILPRTFPGREKGPGEKGGIAAGEGPGGGKEPPLSLIYARYFHREIPGDRTSGRVREAEVPEDPRSRPFWSEKGNSGSTFTLSLPEIRHLVEVLFEPFMERWRRELQKRGYLHVRFP